MGSLTLLQPLLLWGLPLVALPIIAHLFLRARSTTVQVPSLMFFMRVDPRLQARRTIREWLLLLLRMLILLLLILACARPVLQGWGEGGRRSVVILLDNSASMQQAAARGRSCLDQARVAATALVETTGPDDRLALVGTVPDPQLGRPGFIEADRLRERINALRGSAAGGRSATAVLQAVDLLQSAATARRELHIISDAQEQAWSEAIAGLTDQHGIRCIVHRITAADDVAPNVSIAALAAAPGRTLAGRAQRLRLRLQHHGGPALDLRLRLRDDRGGDTLQQCRLEDGEIRELVLVSTAEAPGRHWLQVDLDGDGYAGDNRAAVVWRSHPRRDVVFAAGHAPLFAVACSPAGDGSFSGLRPRSLAVPEFAAALADAATIAAVLPLDAALAAQWPTLEPWLRAGGQLILLPASDAAVAGVDQPLIDLRVGQLQALDQPEAMVSLAGAARRFEALRDAGGQVLLGGARVARWRDLRGDEWRPLLGTAGGAQVLVERDWGAGRIVAAGVAYDPRWTDLPLKAAGLAIAQELVLGAAAADPTIVTQEAGLPAPATGLRQIQVATGDGPPLNWAESSPPALVHAGVMLLSGSGGETLVAVQPDRGEYPLRAIAADRLPALAGLDHQVIDWAGADALRAALADIRLGRALDRPLLLAAVLALLGEALLGTWGIWARQARRPLLPAGVPAAAVIWYPGGQLDALALVVIGLLVLVWVRARLRKRLGRLQTMLVLLPKMVLLALLVLALADPHWRQVRHEDPQGRLAVLIDESSSMDVDDGLGRRHATAWQLADRIVAAAPDGLTVDLRSCGRGLAPADRDAQLDGLRPGDLSACLAQLVGEDAGDLVGAILLSDGGDEALRLPGRLGVPVSIIGIGAEEAIWNDCSLAAVDAPALVEVGTQLQLRLDIEAQARPGDPFLSGLGALAVELYREEEAGGSTLLEQQTVDCRGGRGRVAFTLTAETIGSLRLRCRVVPVAGELTTINNERQLTIQVREQAMQVLYLAQRLGAGFKQLRAELGRDPGLRFSALIRSMGDRFLLLGDARDDGQAIRDLPRSAADLRAVQVLMLGDGRADGWPAETVQAIADWVADGGSLVVLGGESFYEPAVFDQAPWNEILPWHGDSTTRLEAGSFPLGVTAAGRRHAVLGGAEALWTGSVALPSLVTPLVARPTATVLLRARVGERWQPVLALQRVGRGQVMALASDTLWQLARSDDALGDAIGRFWRQGLRSLAGAEEGSGLLRVRWDRPHYRPGDVARLSVSLIDDGMAADGGLSLEATHDDAAGSHSLSVEPGALAGSWQLELPLDSWGHHRLLLRLLAEGAEVERYERELEVGAQVAEGARLAVDVDGLRAVAASAGGRFARPGDDDAIDDLIAMHCAGPAVVSERPLLLGSLWLPLLAGLLMLWEWMTRRKVHLP